MLASAHILAVLTEDYNKLSNAYQPSKELSPSDEYVAGIDLKSALANPYK